jgi:hypothetical protein
MFNLGGLLLRRIIFCIEENEHCKVMAADRRNY